MGYDRAWARGAEIVDSGAPQTYDDFLDRKRQATLYHGFDVTTLPEFLFDFQRALVEWALRKGRAAIFADCGLGKTPMQLVWAQNIVEKTNGRVLVLTPLAVGPQTVREGKKFDIDCHQSRDGSFGDASIIVTNYEKLHLFDPRDFSGIVCDESSILKHFSGSTQKRVTRFASKIQYRLLCTATAAPNDYIELGTSAEALGELGFSDMRGRFFVQDEKPHRMEEVKRWRQSQNTFAKLAYRVAQQGQWRLKGHAEIPFWRWVCSWARACRMPSDLGFDDGAFILPKLVENTHIIEAESNPEGMLFTVPAFGLKAEREERRRTLRERCETVAKLVDHKKPAMVWCHLNVEGDLLTKLIPDARQIKGGDSDEKKEQAYADFIDGNLRVLITKPKIGAWGLNFQHCAHIVTFASHSYEQYYQSVRRCWRFGQKRKVRVDVIATEGEAGVVENMQRKSRAADHMFDSLVKHMNEATIIRRSEFEASEVTIPEWLQKTS